MERDHFVPWLAWWVVISQSVRIRSSSVDKLLLAFLVSYQSPRSSKAKAKEREGGIWGLINGCSTRPAAGALFGKSLAMEDHS